MFPGHGNLYLILEYTIPVEEKAVLYISTEHTELSNYMETAGFQLEWKAMCRRQAERSHLGKPAHAALGRLGKATQSFSNIMSKHIVSGVSLTLELSLFLHVFMILLLHVAGKAILSLKVV